MNEDKKLLTEERRWKTRKLVNVAIYALLSVASIVAFHEDNYPKAIFFVLLLILLELSDQNPRNHR